MKRWQIQIRGENFVRNNVKSDFELGGFISAVDPDDAILRAVCWARERFPELDQTETMNIPRAVVNVEEIEELPSDFPCKANEMEIFWNPE